MRHLLNRVRRSNTEEGLTLVEMMVVVGILGILAAISVPIYLNQVSTAIEAEVKSDVSNSSINIANKVQAKESFTFDPCSSENWGSLKVQTSEENKIECHYYGSSRTVTSAEKKEAYESYEWCVSGARPDDISGQWNWNSRTKQLKEGACEQIGAAPGSENIG